MTPQKFISVLAAFALLATLTTSKALAHCDRENGPVAMAAKEALKTQDFNKIAIWVGEEQEKELKSKFQQSLKVYQKGGNSQELAEDYFMENAVRLHRAAEGMPFTGLKPAKPAAPDIQAAEKALQTGNLEPVMKMFSEAMEDEATRWFQRALEAKKQKDQSLEAGRKWADRYVMYIVYLHKLHQTIEKGPPHGVGK
jgi:hypothetical protein